MALLEIDLKIVINLKNNVGIDTLPRYTFMYKYY